MIPTCGRSARKFQMERHGITVPKGRRVVPTCGSQLCVAFDHLLVEEQHWSHGYRDDQILARLQVVALQLGRTPTVKEWRARHEKPNDNIVRQRFGSWASACKKAGLEPSPASQRGYRRTTTHFACGHERTPENTASNGRHPDGTRRETCRDCKLVRGRRHEERKRGRAA